MGAKPIVSEGKREKEWIIGAEMGGGQGGRVKGDRYPDTLYGDEGHGCYTLFLQVLDAVLGGALRVADDGVDVLAHQHSEGEAVLQLSHLAELCHPPRHACGTIVVLTTQGGAYLRPECLRMVHCAVESDIVRKASLTQWRRTYLAGRAMD